MLMGGQQTETAVTKFKKPTQTLMNTTLAHQGNNLPATQDMAENGPFA
jgi:hypothetical protein